MAVSDVSICNLGLQILGATRINSLTEDSRNARSMNACYEFLRDREIRRYKWNFAKDAAVLAPDSDVAAGFANRFGYAFTFPTDALRIILPTRTNLDWVLAGRKIYTNDGDTLYVDYLKRITDPTMFDLTFVDALAARLADYTCEEITQSNEKKKDAAARYSGAIREARNTNAMEVFPQDSAEDPWLAARR